MCYKRNIEIPSRFIPTEIVDIFKARESIYNFGISSLFTLVTTSCKFKAENTQMFSDLEFNPW